MHIQTGQPRVGNSTWCSILTRTYFGQKQDPLFRPFDFELQPFDNRFEFGRLKQTRISNLTATLKSHGCQNTHTPVHIAVVLHAIPFLDAIDRN